MTVAEMIDAAYAAMANGNHDAAHNLLNLADSEAEESDFAQVDRAWAHWDIATRKEPQP